MATSTGLCANCRQINAYSAINCLECGQRLPWADVSESKTRAEQEAQKLKENAVEAQQAAQRVKAPPMAPTQRTTGQAGSYDGFCPHCGKGYDGHPVYCPRCGGAVVGIDNGGRSVGAAPWVALVVAALIGAWIFAGSFVNQAIDSADPSATPALVFDENNIDKSALESEIRESYNASLKEKDVEISCASVSLVEAETRHFTGFAEMSNGRKVDVEVNFDKSGTYIYKVKP